MCSAGYVDLVTACSFCWYADGQLRHLRYLAPLHEAYIV